MDNLYELALCQTKGIGIQTFKNIINHFNNAEKAFQAPLEKLTRVNGLGLEIAKNIKSFNNLQSIRDQIDLCKRYGITVHSIFDSSYPTLLKQVPDAPSIIFSKPEILEQKLNISIVGTRNATHYGKDVVEEICSQLPNHTTIISGLAIGIDTAAHKAALKYNLKTIAVLGSSIDMIYPRTNEKLASEIVESHGTLISEYLPNTKAEMHHFPMRNRIVAGMSQITIVVESKSKGGSLITAKLANDYNREVYAIPGGVYDTNSQGCNELIANHGAQIFTDVETMLSSINFYIEEQEKKKKKRTQPIDLKGDEEIVFSTLSKLPDATIDYLSTTALISINKIAAVLLTLEFKGYVTAIPGNKFKVKDQYKT